MQAPLSGVKAHHKYLSPPYMFIVTSSEGVQAYYFMTIYIHVHASNVLTVCAFLISYRIRPIAVSSINALAAILFWTKTCALFRNLCIYDDDDVSQTL